MTARTGAPLVGDQPIPIGFGVALDESVRQIGSGVWFGGSPARVMRLTASGRAAWHELDGGAVLTRSAGHLARRLTDAGLAHPRPPLAAQADVTILVPTLDRPEALARCLTALGSDHPVVVVDDGSADPQGIASVTQAYGARLVRREVNGGPAAARNSGLGAIESEFVAFVDSDCIPSPNWLVPLVAHLADPLLAAVAPRIVARAPANWAGRYTAARGSLDLGGRPGRVAPTAQVSYVPTAALLARRSALIAIARSGYVFDPALRFGEDVDLVWRLDAAGWRVRYDPSVQVEHDEPTAWTELWRRRFRYGTSAAPLARAHPRSAAPLVIHPWPALTVGALLARRPVPAAAAFAMTVFTTVRTLRQADIPTNGTVRAMAGAVRQTWLGVGRYGTQFAAPALLAAAVAPGRRGRRVAAASLLLGPPLAAWFERRPDLDPPRFVAAHLADEIAYGTGVWAGCLAGRTTAPLRPLLNRSSRRPRPDQGDAA